MRFKHISPAEAETEKILWLTVSYLKIVVSILVTLLEDQFSRNINESGVEWGTNGQNNCLNVTAFMVTSQFHIHDTRVLDKPN